MADLCGGSPARADRIVAVRAYYEGVTGPADRADLYFSSESFPGYYWLFATDRYVTVWIPLQKTPMEMGPLSFAAGSHTFEHGRDLPISDESDSATVMAGIPTNCRPPTMPNDSRTSCRLP